SSIAGPALPAVGFRLLPIDRFGDVEAVRSGRPTMDRELNGCRASRTRPEPRANEAGMLGLELWAIRCAPVDRVENVATVTHLGGKGQPDREKLHRDRVDVHRVEDPWRVPFGDPDPSPRVVEIDGHTSASPVDGQDDVCLREPGIDDPR